MERAGGRRWEVAPRAPAAFGAALPDVHPVVRQVLYNRGLTTAAAAREFLAGDGAPLHDPRQLYGMDRAIARLRRALQAGETVAVHGDFDVDGVTATAILVEGLGVAGIQTVPHLPQRTVTGYGLQAETVERLAAEGVSLVVTGDTGTRARDAVRRAAELGVDVVVTDHHLPGDDLPPAVAVINPRQASCAYPFKDLSGAGVAWKVVQALAQEDLLPVGAAEGLLDLVALGTIGDVSPLRGENRVLVQRGLRLLADSPRPGIRALLGPGGRRPVDERTVAFSIGPRLNAAGRMDDPRLALELLLTGDAQRAAELARLLGERNEERQRLTEAVLQEARRQARGLDGQPLLVLRGDGWPGGVIGLVAGRIAEEFGRPAFVVDVGPEACRGSGRAAEGVDLVALLTGCADLLLEFGGHAQAAGFAARTQDLDALVGRLLDQMGRGPAPAPPVVVADQALAEGELDWALYGALLPLRPFGQGNPPPLFFTPGLRLLEARPVGASGRHLRVRLRFGKEVFTAFGPDLGPRAPDLARRGHLDVLYALDSSTWEGLESLELRLHDVRPAVAVPA
jgi:single-stranded-DNA-specific exonuclease